MEGSVTNGCGGPLADYLTVPAVATMFGVERQTVRVWIRKRLLPAIRMDGNVFLIHKKDLENFQRPRSAWFDAVRTVRAEREMVRRATQSGEASTPPTPAEEGEVAAERTNQ